MKLGRRTGIALAIALAALLPPATAAAVDSDLKHAFAFEVEASNGYSILAVAANERADGRGEVVLIVSRKRAAVLYVAPARLTATGVEADLGALGSISLEALPSGRRKSIRLRCDEGPKRVSFEPQSFRGSFEFHGEEGYAEASSRSPREYTRFFVDALCAGVSSGETGGADLPGARLRLHSHRGFFRLDLQANRNRPGARTRFEVETHERRGRIAISRSRTLWAGSEAFDYDPLLRTATLEPPAPFSGHADFHRDAIAANRWSGNLSVDLPGRADVPLTGSGIGATLVHSCWHDEGLFRC